MGNSVSELKREMKRHGVRIVSHLNGGLSELEYHYNSRLFALKLSEKDRKTTRKAWVDALERFDHTARAADHLLNLMRADGFLVEVGADYVTIEDLKGRVWRSEEALRGAPVTQVYAVAIMIKNHFAA